MRFFTKIWFGFYRIAITDVLLVEEMGFSFYSEKKEMKLADIAAIELIGHDVAPHLLLSFDSYHLLVTDTQGQKNAFAWSGVKKAVRLEFLWQLSLAAPQATLNEAARRDLQQYAG